ncbi:hypothetical protein TrST_g11448 [Triparma strigata]|uniref:Calmodulin n=1 Tax=Triparma strigata TaxID=1606541 RepID=A0A9W7E4U2_9STRA|nr:hypothetical protein TrST_g11448 [Triparma strigata]
MEDRDGATHRVIEGLKELYKTRLLPVEKLYSYHHFFSNQMTDAEFDAKPQVLMIGQYSTGKTSFIKYLIGRDFPGQRIGPEPTTDRFVCVMNGSDERVVPGNALSVSPDLPYHGLQQFGVSFLNKLEGAQLPSPVLRNISIVDTPGILSGEKQRVARGYNFVQVCGWFAERADLILLLFDAHKLDISDEFRTVIDSLKGQDDKIRCVLNKADQVDRQKLMRVYGALMWAMGKVTKTPEVLRVYAGSFWDQPLQHTDNAKLFELEEKELMADLKNLPRNSAVRKINELVKRARKCKVHAYIMAYLRSQMPSMTGKQKKQEQLIKDLPNVFRAVMKKYSLAAGDFPELEKFREKLGELNFSKFPKLNDKMIAKIDEMLNSDIPHLMDSLPTELKINDDGLAVLSGKMNALTTEMPSVPTPKTHTEEESRTPPKPPGGEQQENNPFAEEEEEEEDNNPFGRETEEDAVPWELQDEKDLRWDSLFLESGAESVDSKLDAGKARKALMATGVPTKSLRAIWDLSDIDKDGKLDAEEFTIAMHLCEMVQEGGAIPEQLEEAKLPISKRK